MFDSDLIIPFGKHKGKSISEIPSGYLYWLAQNCDDDNIATLADEEYQRRTDEYDHNWED